MITKTFFLTKEIRAIRTKTLRDNKTFHDHARPRATNGAAWCARGGSGARGNTGSRCGRHLEAGARNGKAIDAHSDLADTVITVRSLMRRTRVTRR